MDQNFWEKVTKTETCWVWDVKKPHYYGTYKREQAHRVSWEMVNGPIPEGMVVCHTCDNPPCVNPDHLFIGTRSENARDMVKKGRGRQAGKPVPEGKPRMKNLAFYHDNAEDMKLHELLSFLPTGLFSSMTKRMWRKYLAENPDILELPQNYKK